MIVLQAAWAITNMCCGKTEQTAAIVSAGIVPIFCTLLTTLSSLAFASKNNKKNSQAAIERVQLLEQVVWALGNIALERGYRDICLDHGVLKPLLLLLEQGKLAVGSSRVDLQACKLEYSIVSPK